MVKQVIIVRKDLNMSKGKMAAQVAHASMYFLIKDCINSKYKKPTISFDKDAKDWFNTGFTKIILEVADKNQFDLIIEEATNKGFVKDSDFFIVNDLCHTELSPENDDGTCSTCIGFKPMDSSKIDGLTKKLRLFKE